MYLYFPILLLNIVAIWRFNSYILYSFFYCCVICSIGSVLFLFFQVKLLCYLLKAELLEGLFICMLFFMHFVVFQFFFSLSIVFCYYFGEKLYNIFCVTTDMVFFFVISNYSFVFVLLLK